MTPARVRSFPPVAGRSPRVLILGSMPGEASLKAGQYYAHPRNAFWRILAGISGSPDPLSYRSRLSLLKKNRIALWDVFASCVRPGSSDSAIEGASAAVNDIPAFLSRYRKISLICLNGGKAEEYFRKAVLPRLKETSPRLRYIRLPSTSPAYAGMSCAAKLNVWRAAILRGRGR